MPPQIIIYSLKRTARLDYILCQIYQEILGGEGLSYVENLNQLQAASPKALKINYSRTPLKGLINIPNSSNLLWEDTIQLQQIELKWEGSLPYAFEEKEQNEAFQLGFDLHAWLFYLVSRYEEYLPFKADQHGRFAATESLAFQAGFLKLPVVNLWGEYLRRLIQKKFPHLDIPSKPKFSYQPSYDIDYAWMYKHKGWKRNLGGLGRDLLKGKLKEVGNRIAVWRNQKEDPYYTFSYLDELHQKYPELKPIYFWLLGDYGAYDKNVNPDVEAMQDLIREHQQYLMGIHPSYASNSRVEQLKKESGRLESILKKKILISRQHFLKLNFPDTYRQLIQAGMQADYSMGYADQIGFRASIATPFYWYDLEQEESTDLKIHPFMFMDVTLKRYMKLDKEEVFNEIQPIIELTKSVGGQLMTIWHNNSFCESEGWEGWRKVYEDLLECI